MQAENNYSGRLRLPKPHHRVPRVYNRLVTCAGLRQRLYQSHSLTATQHIGNPTLERAAGDHIVQMNTQPDHRLGDFGPDADQHGLSAEQSGGCSTWINPCATAVSTIGTPVISRIRKRADSCSIECSACSCTSASRSLSSAPTNGSTSADWLNGSTGTLISRMTSRCASIVAS